MNPNKTSLMKIFSLVLKERAKTESTFRSISPEMVKYFSRKELIEMITQKFQSGVPEQYNLMELENEGLLKIIGDDFYIISYLTGQWSKEVESLPLRSDKPFIPASVQAASAKVEAKKNEIKKEDPKQGEKKD